MKKLIVLTTALLLTACETTGRTEIVREVIEQTPIVYHPPLPDPVTCESPQFSVTEAISIDGYRYASVGMTYNDSLEFRKCEEETLSYIEHMATIVCYYRRGISDPLCGEQDADTETKDTGTSESLQPK